MSQVPLEVPGAGGDLSKAGPEARATLAVTGFLRQPQVLGLVPISKSTLWRRVQAKTFPRPLKLSDRVTVWRADDVRAWIQAQGDGQP